MADNNIPQYPFMFSPDQWSNKYSAFNTGTQMPGWPTQYSGVPTDALGRPIQSYLDAQAANAAAPRQAAPVTLNTNPNQDQWRLNNAIINGMPLQERMPGIEGSGRGVYQGLDIGNIVAARTLNNQMYGRNAQPAQPTATGGGIDMGAAYLNALSNPGKVVTPGATVPQSAPPSGQSGVLQSFLQNWQNRGSPTTGAGGYNNAGFFNALKGAV